MIFDQRYPRADPLVVFPAWLWLMPIQQRTGFQGTYHWFARVQSKDKSGDPKDKKVGAAAGGAVAAAHDLLPLEKANKAANASQKIGVVAGEWLFLRPSGDFLGRNHLGVRSSDKC